MNGPLIELREESPGKLVLRGYASVSERWYPVSNMFEEKVNRGTWKRCLADGPDTVLVADHEGLAFARTKTPSGTPTLLLSETDRGLHCEAFLDATAPRVQDLRSTSENAGLQMSVGFICSEDNWNEDRSRRELIQASVHRGDVTVCNYGANNAASATITGRGEAGEAERRAHAETLTGSRERRMCPMLDGYELESSSTLTVARRPRLSSDVEWAKGKRAKLGRNPGAQRASLPPHKPLRRSYVEEAKAKRARLRYAHGRPTKATRGRGELRRLPLSPWGEDWEIKDATDVAKAVLQVEVGHAAGPEEEAIKAWVWQRAEALDATSLVPAAWKNATPLAKPTQKGKPALKGRGAARTGQSQ
jgi:HK97 family phage prohead protease